MGVIKKKTITNFNYSEKTCNSKGLRAISNYVIKNNQ